MKRREGISREIDDDGKGSVRIPRSSTSKHREERLSVCLCVCESVCVFVCLCVK